MIDRERFHELVDKYLDKNLTTKEEEELEEYYSVYGKQIFHSNLEQETKKQLYQNISSQAMSHQKATVQKRRRHLAFKVAAVISILMILGISSLFWLPTKQAELITMTSRLGERRQIVLPDSSLVTLNAGSSITYPEFFTGSTRKVEMTGEVFFEVTHNPDRPFWVTTSGLDTRVLGTSFNIKAYGDTPDIKISLATGSIQISKQDLNMATLKPDEQMLYDKSSGHYKIIAESTDKDISWLDNIIELDDHSIEETRRIVERWFNVKLNISNGKKTEQTITGKFIDPTLEETIESLELLTGSKITYENQVEPLKTHSP
ncbi:FecR domain-containing protein [Muricauda sp. 334s03]|uniref:FecR domain-containing protein n=1 Tax=Flagellimonas yonaguniensis TaxID=3031325 RepID=A0ABT5Y182_9FLAO|nr:FecR family protein [[Muricauda] yonaguniensis]MDF0717133.1 FecR domain-containing protein [[Muricauda] yonaguniensis]